jgi:hypothetical protein
MTSDSGLASQETDYAREIQEVLEVLCERYPPSHCVGVRGMAAAVAQPLP